MSLMGILDRVADNATFDKAISPAQRAVQAVLKPQALKDLLHGTWLGHPLHPVLVQVPVGSWTSAGLLDAIPLDDAKTFQLFSEGQTYGVFQFESSGMRELLRKAKPERLDALIALNAL